MGRCEIDTEVPEDGCVGSLESFPSARCLLPFSDAQDIFPRRLPTIPSNRGAVKRFVFSLCPTEAEVVM